MVGANVNVSGPYNCLMWGHTCSEFNSVQQCSEFNSVVQQYPLKLIAAEYTSSSKLTFKDLSQDQTDSR